MDTITLTHKVHGLTLICRQCGNTEESRDLDLVRFRVEGLSRDTGTLRCLYCQAAVTIGLHELDPIAFARAS
ncbi:hypothetical protein [Halomonas sp. BM-2019]|uniref:hypothetical protein n=1 Tax=Halomonas sp. BM-2019 TaxID=2811227 RepID=UPI001B3C3C3F|nr:MAG: hypothetical protein J5F18_07800 [Halomonas sp. BM-2019]